jgi:hypothetical protein
MRRIIVLALVSLVVINAAPLSEEDKSSKHGAAATDLSRKLDRSGVKTMLEKYGAKYDQALMSKMMQRGRKLPKETKTAFTHEKMGKRDILAKYEDKLAHMKTKSMPNKSAMKEKFMSLKKMQHETAPAATKLKTLDDVKNFKLTKSFKVLRSVQLPEKFQKKLSL